MRRLMLAFILTGALFGATVAPALAFIHVTIPADECATNAAVTPGNATDAPVVQGGQVAPLGNVTNAPTDCPAP